MRISQTCILLVVLACGLQTGCQSFRKSLHERTQSLLSLDRNQEDNVNSDDLLDPLGARDTNRLVYDDLTPSQIGTTLKVKANGGADPEKAREHYRQGQQFYREGVAALEANSDADAAREIFEKAANEFRLASAYGEDTAIEEDALYFEGESFFFADRYVQANRAFEKLIRRYSGTRHLDMAENRRYAIAVYWLQMADKTSAINLVDTGRPRMGMQQEARRILHQIRLDDPTGKLADDAALTLAKAFLQIKRYYEAADTLEDLRKSYPGSKHQFDAHMLELEARLASYQGASYDEGPLKKADEILRSILRQFPQQAEENRSYLEQRATQIRNLTAERDLQLAEYFERRGENLAAQFYYEKLEREYQGSQVADEVRERLADVKQKPPRPEEHLEWLVNLFPDPEKAKPVIMAGDNASPFSR